MIKFKYAIHKATQILFTYEDWLKYKDDNRYWNIVVDKDTKVRFKPMDMILSDDFEIIYNSDFTIDDLKEMRWNMDISVNNNRYNIIDKINEELSKRYNLINRFGIKED